MAPEAFQDLPQAQDKLEHEHLAGAEVRGHKTLDEALEGGFSCHQ